VNHKGLELRLAKAFLETVKEAHSPDVTYEAFDFHKECGLNRWDRLSILMDKIALDQEQFGYFMQVRDTSRIKIYSVHQDASRILLRRQFSFQINLLLQPQ